MEIEKQSDSSFSERHAAWKSSFCEGGYMFMRAEERCMAPPCGRGRGRCGFLQGLHSPTLPLSS